MSVSAPEFASMVNTCLEPGDIDKLTVGAIFLPFKSFATLSISKSDELVHEPMQT